jgi:hypothetical protein
MSDDLVSVNLEFSESVPIESVSAIPTPSNSPFFDEETNGSFVSINYPFGDKIYRIDYININGKGFYYFDQNKYDLNFPLVWALDPHNYVVNNVIMCCSGPAFCGNCAKFGTINGVFAFYCPNCNEYIYDGQRGSKGFFTCENITQEQLDVAFPYLQGKLKNDICSDPWNSESSFDE